jgi:hypothetical protein
VQKKDEGTRVAGSSSSPKPSLSSSIIQQPNYKPNYKQRHEAINEHISRIDNQREDDDTFNN